MNNETEILGPESYMIVREEQEECDDPTLTFMDDVEKEIESTGEALLWWLAFLLLLCAAGYVVTN